MFKDVFNPLKTDHIKSCQWCFQVHFAWMEFFVLSPWIRLTKPNGVLTIKNILSIGWYHECLFFQTWTKTSEWNYIDKYLKADAWQPATGQGGGEGGDEGHLGPFWGHVGATLGSSWAILGAWGYVGIMLVPWWAMLGHVGHGGHVELCGGDVGAKLGPSWGRVGRCWRHVEAMWKLCWASLGGRWAVVRLLAATMGHFNPGWGPKQPKTLWNTAFSEAVLAVFFPSLASCLFLLLLALHSMPSNILVLLLFWNFPSGISSLSGGDRLLTSQVPQVLTPPSAKDWCGDWGQSRGKLWTGKKEHEWRSGWRELCVSRCCMILYVKTSIFLEKKQKKKRKTWHQQRVNLGLWVWDMLLPQLNRKIDQPVLNHSFCWASRASHVQERDWNHWDQVEFLGSTKTYDRQPTLEVDVLHYPATFALGLFSARSGIEPWFIYKTTHNMFCVLWRSNWVTMSRMRSELFVGELGTGIGR